MKNKKRHFSLKRLDSLLTFIVWLLVIYFAISIVRMTINIKWGNMNFDSYVYRADECLKSNEGWCDAYLSTFPKTLANYENKRRTYVDLLILTPTIFYGVKALYKFLSPNYAEEKCDGEKK